MPETTAEKPMKRAWLFAAMIRASVVLPLPGGPQKTREGTLVGGERLREERAGADEIRGPCHLGQFPGTHPLRERRVPRHDIVGHGPVGSRALILEEVARRGRHAPPRLGPLLDVGGEPIERRDFGMLLLEPAEDLERLLRVAPVEAEDDRLIELRGPVARIAGHRLREHRERLVRVAHVPIRHAEVGEDVRIAVLQLERPLVGVDRLLPVLDVVGRVPELDEELRVLRLLGDGGLEPGEFLEGDRVGRQRRLSAAASRQVARRARPDAREPGVRIGHARLGRTRRGILLQVQVRGREAREQSQDEKRPSVRPRGKPGRRLFRGRGLLLAGTLLRRHRRRKVVVVLFRRHFESVSSSRAGCAAHVPATGPDTGTGAICVPSQVPARRRRGAVVRRP